jgi:hypothetical protein
MIYYATYDNNGDYTGFYTKEIHGDNIPSPNIELSEEQWAQAQSNRCRVVNGIHTHFPITEQEILHKKYAILRSERDTLLARSDWTQMPDAQLTEEQKQAWQIYRQQLRDLPETADINNIIYPAKPE